MIASSSSNAPSTTKVERDYLSFSAINTYRGCPLRYYFRYIEQLPEPTVSSALVFGAAIHSAVEFWYCEQLAGNPEPTTEQLLQIYQSEWKSRETEQIQFGRGETLQSLSELAERVIDAFTASELSKPNGRILAVEEELRGPLVGGCPDILARLDLIVETDDALVITDFKTSRSRWSAEQAEQSGEQLLLYAELAKDLMPDKSLQLEFVVATKTKQPSVDRHTVFFDEARSKRTRRMVERVWQGIDAGLFYPAPSPMTCSGCPFREPCRSWGS